MMHLRMGRRRSRGVPARKSYESIDAKLRPREMPARARRKATFCSLLTRTRELLEYTFLKRLLCWTLVTQAAARAWRWMDSFRFGDAFCCVRLAHSILG